jgi:hypothetical protein
MSLELSQEAVRQLNNNLKRSVQIAKVRDSKITISKLQQAGQFAPNKDITSYVTSKHQGNKYNDINKFYKTMLDGPKWWNKRFFFVGPMAGENLNQRISEAAAMAIDIARRQTLSYPSNYSSAGPRETASTGHLLASIRTYVNGIPVNAAPRQIRNSTGTALFEMTNIAEYGSTAEARAVYVTRQNGLIFYAANRVQTQFPDLGIMFRFVEADTFMLPHVYNVPVLTIGSPDQVSGPWVRPGGNIIKRRKQARRAASSAARINRKING